MEATPRRIEAQVGPQAEHEVVLECEAAGGGERALDARPVALPEGHAEEGGGRRPRLVDRLDQVEVGVARSGVVEVGDLALHPQVAGEQRADALADQFGQFGHGQDRQVGVSVHPVTVGLHADAIPESLLPRVIGNLTVVVHHAVDWTAWSGDHAALGGDTREGIREHGVWGGRGRPRRG